MKVNFLSSNTYKRRYKNISEHFRRFHGVRIQIQEFKINENSCGSDSEFGSETLALLLLVYISLMK
jgi:hypothetical protein